MAAESMAGGTPESEPEQAKRMPLEGKEEEKEADQEEGIEGSSWTPVSEKMEKNDSVGEFDSDEDFSHEDLADILEADLIKVDELEGDGIGSSGEDETGDGEGVKDTQSIRIRNGVPTPKKLGEDIRKDKPSKLQKIVNSSLLAQLPSELHYHILKFLSPEDLSTCSLVCRFLRTAAADDILWRRGYCLRWGAPKDRKGKQGSIPWKQLYFDRDRADMEDVVQTTPEELRGYFIQIQTAKRNITPTMSQIKDDLIVVASTVAQEVSEWRRTHGFSDVSNDTSDHVCNGRICSFHQIDDVFLCEKSGIAHVCDESCRETFFDPDTQLLVCSISGHCFDTMFSAQEEYDRENTSLKAAGALSAEEFEPLMGAGRLVDLILEIPSPQHSKLFLYKSKIKSIQHMVSFRPRILVRIQL